MSELHTFIKSLPKAELHLHLEGSLEPEQMFEFAARNNVKLPYETVEDIRKAYNFNNLQEFLDIYYAGMSVLRTEQDFYELTLAYLKKAQADNVKHVEVFFDPQGHTERGLDFSIPIKGIQKALAVGREEMYISSKLIMCFLRHLSEEQAFATLEQARSYLAMIDGVGLDSSELGHPPSKFARVFAKAKDLGLYTVAHAGEEGPPEYVREALDILKVDRLDHGNRSMEDEALIEQIREQSIALTVCPLSNLKLCVVNDMAEHPAKKMLEKQLLITINSDDPSYFGGYVNDNYIALADALQLDKEDIIQLVKNSFIGSFLNEEKKAQHLKIVNYHAQNYTDKHSKTL